MSSQPHFNEHYKSLLDQLPPSMKKDAWLRLTARKNNPLSMEQARGIRPDIEELLTKEVNRYYNKKNRQKIKIEANVIPEGSSTLSRLDGFEKQLEEREHHLQQQEINIKNTVETQVAEERKRLKDEYDTLKNRLESEYNKCMVDMKQTIYSFKHQLEEQQKSRSVDLEGQYKSRISALEKSIVIKDKEIGKLSSSISQAKKDKSELKKDLASAKKIIKELDDIIYNKDQTIIAYNDGIRSIDPGCIDNTIEPSSFYEKDAKILWNRLRDDAPDEPDIRKKYTFRSRIVSSIIGKT
jgi:chromosome segregation ATPase